MSPLPAVPVSLTVVYSGRRYRITRRADVDGPGTRIEHWPGRGCIGSTRAWLGSRFATTLSWYATVNTEGRPFTATGEVEGLASRRAALDWLFSHTTTPEN